MKPHVVSKTVRPYRWTAPTGKMPHPLLTPGTMYVKVGEISSWHGWHVKIVTDHVDGRIQCEEMWKAEMSENGIILVGEAIETRRHFEYAWGNDTVAILRPLDTCMFHTSGLRRGLIASRSGSYSKDDSTTHMFSHNGERYKTACHIDLDASGYSQFLKLRSKVTCHYCNKILEKGDVNEASFLRV